MSGRGSSWTNGKTYNDEVFNYFKSTLEGTIGNNEHKRSKSNLHDTGNFNSSSDNLRNLKETLANLRIHIEEVKTNDGFNGEESFQKL